MDLPTEITKSSDLVKNCEICGENHDIEKCTFLSISKHVPDNPIPSKAKLTLPDSFEVRKLSDDTFTTAAIIEISTGTQFGPFQAEKSGTLDPSILFPLKIFSADENGNYKFLVNNDEEKCSWLMYIAVAETYSEQNLICYQVHGEIYYCTIKHIHKGETLKVWYSPYYATKMNKSVLQDICIREESAIDVNQLIKKQQKIIDRKSWICKFCSQVEKNVVEFAKHILLHYSAHERNMCGICKKTFGTKKGLRNHLNVVHHNPKIKATKLVSEDCKDIALGGPMLNDLFTDSSDLNQFDPNIDNQNLLLENDNFTVDTLLNDNVKDLDHFNFEIDECKNQFICDICLKQFTKLKLLIIHLRYHTGEFICDKCLKVFCRKENLINHACNIRTYFPCSICDKSFTQRKYLSRHVQACHNKKFRCVVCDKHYYSNKELLQHNCTKIPISEKEKFLCPICDKCFYRDEYLRRHLEKHGSITKPRKKKSLFCEVCGLLFEKRSSFYTHRKNHKEPLHLCQICNKKFYRLDCYTKHSLLHQDNSQFECEICSRKFKKKSYLSGHLKSHDPNKPYVQCTVCNINCKNRITLKRHVKCHDQKQSSVGYYNCSICDRKLKLKSSLLRHIRKDHNSMALDSVRRNRKRNVDIKDIQKDKQQNEHINSDGDGLLQSDLDTQIKNLLQNAEDNLSIEKQAVDSLVKELGMHTKMEEKKTHDKEICLSIPDLSETFEDVTLDKNAYILENGTIVQPQADSDNVVIYVLDQPY